MTQNKWLYFFKASKWVGKDFNGIRVAILKGNPMHWAFGVGVDEVGEFCIFWERREMHENTPIELRF